MMTELIAVRELEFVAGADVREQILVRVFATLEQRSEALSALESLLPQAFCFPANSPPNTNIGNLLAMLLHKRGCQCQIRATGCPLLLAILGLLVFSSTCNAVRALFVNSIETSTLAALALCLDVKKDMM